MMVKNTFKHLLRPLIRPVKSALRPLLYSRRPPLCENVVIWALSAGYQVKRIHEPFSVDLPMPIGCESDARAAAVFDAHSKIALPAQFLICLPGGGVPGSIGFTTMPNGEFLIESVCRPQYLLDSSIYRSRLPLKKRWLEGDYYNLITFFGGNYAHWLWEDLPRLFAALPHLPTSTRFLVPRSIRQFQKDSLSLLGIEPERLVIQETNVNTRCERLWFATALGNQDWAVTAPDTVQQMRATLLKSVGEDAPSGARRVYVSRSGLSKNRRVSNEDALLSIIKDYDFEIVFPERLSLADQIGVFKDANVVLGAHGAGLTNILFCPPKSTVLELQDSVFAPRCWYWKLAATLGHEWRCYVSEADNRQTLKWADWPAATFHIDVQGFAEFMQAALVLDAPKAQKQWWSHSPWFTPPIG
jgi:capsular polysaccharide biosynthesis protein